MKKRVGIREAKKIFHKRPLKNQLRDRQKTSKKLVNPYSKNSYKWKQNPNQYDMRGVDTKTLTPKAIKNNQVYTYFGKTNTLNKAQQIQKETLEEYAKFWLYDFLGIERYPVVGDPVEVQVSKSDE